MDQPVERETVGAFEGRYSCSCGFDSGMTVYGLGQGTSSATWGLWVDRAVRRAEVAAAAAAESNADLVLALTPCPSCGRRSAARRLTIALAVLVVLVLGLGWLALVVLSWRFASLALTGMLLVLVFLVRFWVVAYWMEARQRVAFHDRPEGTQTVRVPVTRHPHASVGPTLMLGFGATGVWFASNDAFFLLRQSEPATIPCERDAIRSASADTWLQVDCAIAYTEFELDPIGENAVVYLPVGQAGQSPIAWLELHHSDAEAFIADPDAAEREQRFAPPAGILGDEKWGNDLSAARVIDPNQPRWRNVGFGSALGLILLPLAAVYWPRRQWSTTVV